MRPLSSEEVAAGKSADFSTFNPSCDGHPKPRAEEGGTLSAFEKRLVVRAKFNRTANRHRWAGREY